MESKQFLKEILDGNQEAIIKLKQSSLFANDKRYKELIGGGSGANIKVLAMNLGHRFDCWVSNKETGHGTKVTKEDYEKYFKNRCVKITMDLTKG